MMAVSRIDGSIKEAFDTVPHVRLCQKDAWKIKVRLGARSLASSSREISSGPPDLATRILPHNSCAVYRIKFFSKTVTGSYSSSKHRNGNFYREGRDQ